MAGQKVVQVEVRKEAGRSTRDTGIGGGRSVRLRQGNVAITARGARPSGDPRPGPAAR